MYANVSCSLTCPTPFPRRVQVREDGTLVIQEVLQTDEGEYVCEASNPAGTRKSPPAILDVIGKKEGGCLGLPWIEGWGGDDTGG